MDNIFKTRLLMLASFLEALPKDRFDYQLWVGSDWQGKPDLSCGTRACALGWATTIPELAEAGLMLQKGKYSGYVVLREGEKNVISAPHIACEAVFGLSRAETEYLFMPNSRTWLFEKISPPHTATAKEVADHIRFFVSQKYPD